MIYHTPPNLRCIPGLNGPARRQLSSAGENLTHRRARIDLFSWRACQFESRAFSSRCVWDLPIVTLLLGVIFSDSWYLLPLSRIREFLPPLSRSLAPPQTTDA